MARWGRAARALCLPPGSRVLDLGCAFGFGTRLLAKRYSAFGHDLNRDYIARAKRTVPGATFTVGNADSVPYSEGFFDGALLLDVLEHVLDEVAVLNEVARVLTRGGTLILTVPNQGRLASLDSLNVYRTYFGAGAPPPTDDPSWSRSPVHRHYRLIDLQRLMTPNFEIEDVQYTGVGIAEPINLVLLVLFRRVFRLPRLYAVLQYLYFGVYILEDFIPTSDSGYHMTVKARRR